MAELMPEKPVNKGEPEFLSVPVQLRPHTAISESKLRLRNGPRMIRAPSFSAGSAPGCLWISHLWQGSAQSTDGHRLDRGKGPCDEHRDSDVLKKTVFLLLSLCSLKSSSLELA